MGEWTWIFKGTTVKSCFFIKKYCNYIYMVYSLEMKGGETMKKFNISMPLEFYSRVKEKAVKKGLPVSMYIRLCISELWEIKGE